MTPACMTAAEHDLWWSTPVQGREPTAIPCTDCPLSYAAEMLVVGRCNRAELRQYGLTQWRQRVASDAHYRRNRRALIDRTSAWKAALRADVDRIRAGRAA